MKRTLLTAGAAILSVALVGCGGSETSTSPQHTTASPTTTQGAVSPLRTPPGYEEYDGDIDDRAPATQHAEADDPIAFHLYPQLADARLTGSISALVRRYYAAAAAGNGVAVCAMLYPSFAEGLANGRSLKTQSGKRACAAATKQQLSSQHRQLVADDAATMVVTEVHLNGDLALASLTFKSMPRSTLLLQRDQGHWTVGALVGNNFP